MRYFRHRANENSLTLYPIVCWHIGAPQSDRPFILETIERIKADPKGRVIYMGDGGECTTRASKGDIFSQTMNLQEQHNTLLDLLKPIKDKILFGVRGNHGHRVYKETGLEFDEVLMMGLQKPYLGVSAFWHLELKYATFGIYTHHGLSSGSSMASKVNKAIALNQSVNADVTMSAHSHICTEVPPHHTAYLSDSPSPQGGDPIRWRTNYSFICGCAYDSRTGYAEDKGYSPILPAHMSITLTMRKENRGTNIRRMVTHTIWRKEA